MTPVHVEITSTESAVCSAKRPLLRMHYGLTWLTCSCFLAVSEAWVRNRVAQANLWRLATAYRDCGHRKANLDPLGMWQRESPPELSLAGYGLEGKEDELFRTEGIVFAFPRLEAPLSQIVQHLELTYCGTMALEVAHVEVSRVGSTVMMEPRITCTYRKATIKCKIISVI